MSNTLPHIVPDDKPHYVYTLAYPESIGGHVFYIGKGIGRRIYAHERDLKKGKPSINTYKDRVIQKIWRKGEEVEKQYLAFFATHEEAIFYEIALIFFMRPYEHLTNLTDGGEGLSGFIYSEESRQQMSDAQKKSSKNQEVREISRARRARGELTEKEREHLRQLNAANKGRKYGPMSEETKRILSEAKKGQCNPWVAEANRQRADSKREPIEMIPCACGCGTMIPSRSNGRSRQFAINHQTKKPTIEMIPCACGCGTLISVRVDLKRKPSFVNHHGNRKPVEMIPCACGCGTMIPSRDASRRKRSYVNRHERRGKGMSEETKRKISETKRNKSSQINHKVE